jgi:hypothetical protein
MAAIEKPTSPAASGIYSYHGREFLPLEYGVGYLWNGIQNQDKYYQNYIKSQ